MSGTELNIVSFENPYPPDYGGAIEVFYKLKALHKQGIVIYLHIFVENRTDYSGLKKYCKRVYTYSKNKTFTSYLSLRPLSVKFRTNKKLADNLKRNSAPILFEGLHTTAVLNKHDFKGRKLIMRAHNIEHHYYRGLAGSATNLFYKYMLTYEAHKFSRYEKIVDKVDHLLAISNHEFDYFKENYKPNCHYIPAFQSYDTVKKLSQFGEYALYHGDLSIIDNLRTARFFIEIFSELDFPLIIAGSKNMRMLMKETAEYRNISCRRIESRSDLQHLFAKSHINLCYSFQRSGTKLKVVHALYEGRHCLVNKNVIDEQLILDQCTVAESKEEVIAAIQKLQKSPYKVNTERQEALDKVFNTEVNARKIIALLD